MGRALDLDHIGAEPGQHLGAGGAGLVMGKVDGPNAFESLISRRGQRSMPAAPAGTS
jgi:hypothetical protein